MVSGQHWSLAEIRRRLGELVETRLDGLSLTEELEYLDLTRLEIEMLRAEVLSESS
jgi:hypothetical protein